MGNEKLDKKLVETALSNEGDENIRCKKVAYLLGLGGDVNAKDEHGTPLIVRLVASDRHFAVAKIFMEKGADVNKTDNTWKSALMIASKYGNLEMVSNLIDRGASLYDFDRQGWTALFYAAYYGNEDVVKELIKRGAEVNHFSTQDVCVSPLMAGCIGWRGESSKNVIRVLLENNANMEVKNKDGETVFDFAKSSSNDDLLEFLKAEKARLRGDGVWNNLCKMWNR